MNWIKVKIIFLLFGLKVSRKTYDNIKKRQFKKGLNKYGMTLAEQPENAYNWLEMAIEEVVDFVEYCNKIKSLKK